MKQNRIYSYPEMEKKLLKWKNLHSSDGFHVGSLGLTYGKRHIYVCHIGAEDAKYQFVVTASIHGREYINTTLLLHMIAYYRKHPWKHIRVSFIPMANPDGVTISMNTDARKWKENGNGIDLNRNFPCGFGLSPDLKKRNPGGSPADQLETQYLMEFINSLTAPLGVIHYHSRGNVIFYDYNVTGSLRNQIVQLADSAHKTTGYKLVHGSKDTKPAGGFGDWCVYEKKIPSITIETGFLKTPVPRWQLNGICDRNLFLLRDLFARIL